MTARAMAVGLFQIGLLSGAALGQSNVGALLDAGGKALTKEEVLSVVNGATAVGPLGGGGEVQIEWKDNGTVGGYVVNAVGRRGALFGTWNVDDRGRICRDYNVRFYDVVNQVKDCFLVYRLGDRYFLPAGAPNAAEPRATGIIERTFKR